MRIGFIGLGNMGQAMARNLIQAGHQVTVHNRTRSQSEALAAIGAGIAETPGEAALGDAVITMLADDPALEAAVFGDDGIIGRLATQAIHVSMSTISVALAERLTAAHRQAGQVHVAAPVFGRPEAAAAARLFVVAAGPAGALARCRPLFDAMGQRTFVFGDRPASAHLVKLSGNFLLAAVVESLSEAFALTRKSGIDSHDYLEFLTGTLFAAPVFGTYGGLIADGLYLPAGFKMTLGLKDVRLELAAAEAAGVPLPIASLVRDQLISGIARGLGDSDWSALGQVAAENAGIGD